MHIILLLILVGVLILGPQWWARHTLRRHGRDLPRLPGTGGELARHLLDRFDMQAVTVEATDRGDHYDPGTRSVRLAPEHYAGRSLSAVAVAAHEVGHAIQHQRGEALLKLRTRLVLAANGAQRLGALAMLAIPVLAAITRAPSAGLVLLLVGVGSLLVGTLMHLVTLPVELDASFGKALPILREGYIGPEDETAVRQVLTAAALTYVAASLASVLNIGRWWAILRR